MPAWHSRPLTCCGCNRCLLECTEYWRAAKPGLDGPWHGASLHQLLKPCPDLPCHLCIVLGCLHAAPQRGPYSPKAGPLSLGPAPHSQTHTWLTWLKHGSGNGVCELRGIAECGPAQAVDEFEPVQEACVIGSVHQDGADTWPEAGMACVVGDYLLETWSTHADFESKPKREASTAVMPKAADGIMQQLSKSLDDNGEELVQKMKASCALSCSICRSSMHVPESSLYLSRLYLPASLRLALDATASNAAQACPSPLTAFRQQCLMPRIGECQVIPRAAGPCSLQN